MSARRYRYTGKERDEETGLYYYGARYYAAWLGRWTSADPLGLQAGVNLYLYCRAGPVTYVDPDGMQDAKAIRIDDQPGAGISDEFDPGGGGAGGAPGSVPRRFAEAPALSAQDLQDLDDPFSEPNMFSTGGGGGDSGEEVYEQLTDWQLFQMEETLRRGVAAAEKIAEGIVTDNPKLVLQGTLEYFLGAISYVDPRDPQASDPERFSEAFGLLYDELADPPSTDVGPPGTPDGSGGGGGPGNGSGGGGGTPPLGKLRSIGPSTWESTGGLVYGPDPKFGNRVEHILAHLTPDPSKPTHSVFNVRRTELLALIDEAWAKKGAPEADDPGAFVVRLGRQVGTGTDQTAVRIIVRPGTNQIITAYPVAP